GAKRLEVLHELVPRAKSIGLLTNPQNPASSVETSDVQAAARTLGLQVYLQNASNDDEVDAAFNNFVRDGNRWSHICCRCFSDHAEPPDHRIGHATCNSDGVFLAGICRRGRADQLWRPYYRSLSFGRRLCGTDS